MTPNLPAALADKATQQCKKIGDESKSDRQALGCLKAVPIQAGLDSTVVDSSLTNVGEAQGKANSCSAKYFSVVHPIMATRMKFFKMTENELKVSPALLDSSGNITGFAFTETNQSDIVKEFQAYSDCRGNLDLTVLTTYRESTAALNAEYTTKGTCTKPTNTQSMMGMGTSSTTNSMTMVKPCRCVDTSKSTTTFTQSDLSR